MGRGGRIPASFRCHKLLTASAWDESRVRGKSSGIPHLAKNDRDTRISCTGHPATATCAVPASPTARRGRRDLCSLPTPTNFTGNPGVWGTRPLVREPGAPRSTSCPKEAKIRCILGRSKAQDQLKPALVARSFSADCFVRPEDEDLKPLPDELAARKLPVPNKKPEIGLP
jgi:hypothetical protein